MDPSEKGAVKSRRLWVTVGVVLFVLFRDQLGITIAPEELKAIVLPIVALILGDSCRGIGVRATSPPTLPPPNFGRPVEP